MAESAHGEGCCLRWLAQAQGTTAAGPNPLPPQRLQPPLAWRNTRPCLYLQDLTSWWRLFFFLKIIYEIMF